MFIRLSEVKTRRSGFETRFTFTIETSPGTEVLFRSVSGCWIAGATTATSLSEGEYSMRAGHQQVSFETRDDELHIYCLVVKQNEFQLYNAEWVIKCGQEIGRLYELNIDDVAQICNQLEAGRDIAVPFTPKDPAGSSSFDATLHFESDSSEENVDSQKLAADRKLKEWAGSKRLGRIICVVTGLATFFAALMVGTLGLYNYFWGDLMGFNVLQASPAEPPLKVGQCISQNFFEIEQTDRKSFVNSVVPCNQPKALHRIIEVNKKELTDCPANKPYCMVKNFPKIGENYELYKNIMVGQCVYSLVYSKEEWTWFSPFSCDDAVLSKGALDEWESQNESIKNKKYGVFVKYQRGRIESIGESRQQCQARAAARPQGKPDDTNFHILVSRNNSDLEFICTRTINDNLYRKNK
ncbi:hypothetical protein [Varibaculum massiliense]|uniref:hypothetical protein n=1 Tax=Varibaculum massiliense TaxID=1852372 RepID=UPI00288A2CF4|nr:hypothetical protein [Varibaculum massiliense]